MWNSKWKAISARISSLLDAGAFLLRTTEADKSDRCGVAWHLSRNADEIVSDLKKLRSDASLPDTLNESLERFLGEYDSCFGSGKINKPSKFTELGGVLPVLASFRSEFEYLLADTEIVARSLSVRAFTHLQRSIIADQSVRERWQEAFEKGETACEGLGACHLLAHGVWGFKTSATGERTDLVLGTPLAIDDDVRRAANALILTEWKLVREKRDLSAKIKEAYLQAKRYSEGILAGFELASRRYLVLVSRDHLRIPVERREAEAVYEYRNLAVSPLTPSARSRRCA
jgi:hypothetical protein